LSAAAYLEAIITWHHFRAKHANPRLDWAASVAAVSTDGLGPELGRAETGCREQKLGGPQWAGGGARRGGPPVHPRRGTLSLPRWDGAGRRGGHRLRGTTRSVLSIGTSYGGKVLSASSFRRFASEASNRTSLVLGHGKGDGQPRNTLLSIPGTHCSFETRSEDMPLYRVDGRVELETGFGMVLRRRGSPAIDCPKGREGLRGLPFGGGEDLPTCMARGWCGDQFPAPGAQDGVYPRVGVAETNSRREYHHAGDIQKIYGHLQQEGGRKGISALPGRRGLAHRLLPI